MTQQVAILETLSYAQLPQRWKLVVDQFCNGNMEIAKLQFGEDMILAVARERRICEIKHAFLEVGFGLTLKSKDRDAWFVILEDPSHPSQYRWQGFDRRGFITHATRSSTDSVIEDAVNCGAYEIVDSKTLDAISSTAQWAEGMQILFKMMS